MLTSAAQKGVRENCKKLDSLMSDKSTYHTYKGSAIK